MAQSEFWRHFKQSVVESGHSGSDRPKALLLAQTERRFHGHEIFSSWRFWFKKGILYGLTPFVFSYFLVD